MPTAVKAAMAAIAIRAAISPYSIAVTPASSWISFVKYTRIRFSKRFKPAQAAAKDLTKRKAIKKEAYEFVKSERVTKITLHKANEI